MGLVLSNVGMIHSKILILFRKDDVIDNSIEAIWPLGNDKAEEIMCGVDLG